MENIYGLIGGKPVAGQRIRSTDDNGEIVIVAEPLFDAPLTKAEYNELIAAEREAMRKAFPNLLIL